MDNSIECIKCVVNKKKIASILSLRWHKNPVHSIDYSRWNKWPFMSVGTVHHSLTIHSHSDVILILLNHKRITKFLFLIDSENVENPSIGWTVGKHSFKNAFAAMSRKTKTMCPSIGPHDSIWKNAFQIFISYSNAKLWRNLRKNINFHE